METWENDNNIRKCPKFEKCSVPCCPLDFWAKDRVQLVEDQRCPNWGYLGVRTSKKMRDGRKSAIVGDILLTIGHTA